MRIKMSTQTHDGYWRRRDQVLDTNNPDDHISEEKAQRWVNLGAASVVKSPEAEATAQKIAKKTPKAAKKLKAE